MATNEELVSYYARLLITQYRTKAKAQETVKTFVRPVIMDQLPASVQNAFDVDTAIGRQLDVIGKYTGISRNVLDFTGQVTLPDDEYRILVQLKIIQNNSGSSLYDIQAQLHQFFAGILFVFDYQNMFISYFFDSNYGTNQLAQVMVRMGLLPKPMAVGMGALIYAPNLIFFGFRTYLLPGYHVVGFNSYSDYQTDWPWLSYQDAI